LTSINPEMHLGNDIGFDSLGLAELTVWIKTVCDIDIFEDGIKKKLFQIKLSLHEILSN
jgi:acyl carrier protein